VTLVRDGIPSAPGIVIARARVLRWEVPRVQHGATVAPDQVEREVERFREACEFARERIRELQARTAESMGPVEAQIFEPQVLMLEDVDLVQGTISYIRESHLTAERAFEWRVLEWESAMSHTSHPMVLDRLNDLADVQTRVQRRLMNLPDPELGAREQGHVILIARELTPSLTVQLDRRHVVGLATDRGTRTSHSSILARSLDIPCVVALGDLSEQVKDGDEIILDGRTGASSSRPPKRTSAPTASATSRCASGSRSSSSSPTSPPRRVTARGWCSSPTSTFPARRKARGCTAPRAWGLYRTEFLVVGRGTAPGEDEQYRAYRQVVQAFPGLPVVIRTFDLGGDKFPAFLHMAPEENPFLGWRAIRVCLDEPAIFKTQLRALLRTLPFGDVRIMLPLINDIEEITATRALLDECAAELIAEGHDAPQSFQLGAMIETPAAAVSAPELARPRGLLLGGHQRPGAVHAGRGPRQQQAGASLQPVPPRRRAPAGPGAPRRPRRRHPRQRLRRAGGDPAGRLHADRHGRDLAERGPRRPRRDQEGDPLGEAGGRRARRWPSP
jgi:phosphotransferase system enzyme I (PtsI)